MKLQVPWSESGNVRHAHEAVCLHHRNCISIKLVGVICRDSEQMGRGMRLNSPPPHPIAPFLLEVLTEESKALSVNETEIPRRRPGFPSLPIHIWRALDGTIKRWWCWRGIIIWQLPESITFTVLISFCFPQRFFQERTAPFLLDLARAFS